jgi:uncharacterized delta-60 repeat protein
MNKIIVLIVSLLCYSSLCRSQIYPFPQYLISSTLYPWSLNTHTGGPGYLDTIADDGLAVLGGYTISPTSVMKFIACYDKNGMLKTTFGNQGICLLPQYNSFRTVPFSTFLTQPDQKFLLAGTQDVDDTTREDFYLVRVNADGSGLDSSFGNEGVVVTDFYGEIFGNDELNDAALQSDGKIVAVGQTYRNFRDGIGLIRYNSNGSIDSSFGINGRVITVVGNWANRAHRVFVMPTGIIRVAAYAYNPAGGDDFAELHYLPDGRLDSSFANNGIAFSDPTGPGNSLVSDAAIQPDGKMVFVGGSPIADSIFMAVRLNTDGTQDQSFGPQGRAIIHVPSECVGKKMSVQGDGKIVLGGDDSQIPGPKSWLILRLLTDGNLDTSFGTGGYISSADLGVSGDLSCTSFITPPSDWLVFAGACVVSSTDYYGILGRFKNNQGVGVSDGNAHNSSRIDIYPNPAKNQVTLIFDTQRIGSTLMTLTNVLGQRVLTKKLSPGLGIHELYIGSMVPGSYTIQVIYNGTTVATGILLISK